MLSQKFSKDTQNEFEISLVGELSFFLGLQICQRNQGIFISQTNYIREMLKRFGILLTNYHSYVNQLQVAQI
jgi:hypothetical protein